MIIYERAEKICSIIRSKMKNLPELALVLGSGLGAFAERIEVEAIIPYAELEGFPVSTVSGHAGQFVFGRLAGKRVVAMQGRIHLYEGYSPEEVTLPMRIFQLLGVKIVVLTNAAGAINTSFNAGDFMALTDHIGLFAPSPLTGVNDERFGTRFPSMSEVYDSSLIELLDSIAKEYEIPLQHGVYAYAKGPMYETPAEIRMLRTLGADAVGMSTVPEAIVAVHGGMKVVGISCLANMAAGILKQPLSHEEVMETGKKVASNFAILLYEFVKQCKVDV